MSVVPLHQPRWDPDQHLIDAAIAGRVQGAHLPASDRAWLVAQLTHRGYTNDTIAAWLRQSRRTVQNARSEPVGVLTARLLAAEAAAEKATSRAKAATITPAALAQLLADLDHLKTVRGNLIDQLAEARRRCGEPCPEQIVIMRPARRRSPRSMRVDLTMPLFEIGTAG
ncbi:hypothetical protein [Nocardia abscessus]|uniref:hypothetical protein n=1 Tax=Nocardia abscessus TaxID=120957 RepID=UPI0024558A91|nr:hypothetical protein [Nocardia abscessus]